jgi:hypothetical protein
MAISYVDGHTLVIEIDLSAGAVAQAPMSASGKTKLLANMRFESVEGAPAGLLVNCCVMVPPTPAKAEPVQQRRQRTPVTQVAATVAKRGTNGAARK